MNKNFFEMTNSICFKAYELTILIVVVTKNCLTSFNLPYFMRYR